MKICIKNLGILEQAEFELGDITIICGSNNTGKTYATYATFGFLHHWQRYLHIPVRQKHIESLVDNGAAQIDISEFFNDADKILGVCCRRYTAALPDILAAKADYFEATQFSVGLDAEEIAAYTNREYLKEVQFGKYVKLTLAKQKGGKVLAASLTSEHSGIMSRNIQHVIARDVSNAVKSILFERHFPKSFIASAERTGAAIFVRELNFARNRLLEEISKSGKDIDPFEVLHKSYQDYALPVHENVDFTREHKTYSKRDGFLAKEHPGILNSFADIIGGEYISGNDDEIYFKPAKTRAVKLSMGESSSAVRSLLNMGLYLRHIAAPGDLLIVDEPELNLHPENQRRVARLFACLANLGIKVFITTHSDYIVRELNTLIMLSGAQETQRLAKIMQREGYNSEETILPDKVRAYIAEKAPDRCGGQEQEGEQKHT